jgi:hypothetical protein
MIKEFLVLTALALGQAPSIVDDHTVRIAGVLVRLIDFATPEPLRAITGWDQRPSPRWRPKLQSIMPLDRTDPNTCLPS